MSKETIETLVSELVHEEDWRRMRATAACVAGGPRAVHALVEALRSGTTELKKEIAAMLARIKDPQAGVALVGLLEDEDEAVRKAGASALEQMAGVLDTETAAALVALLPKTQEGAARQLMTHLVGAIPTAVIPLCEMLKHPDPEAQVTAATAVHWPIWHAVPGPHAGVQASGTQVPSTQVFPVPQKSAQVPEEEEVQEEQ